MCDVKKTRLDEGCRARHECFPGPDSGAAERAAPRRANATAAERWRPGRKLVLAVGG